MNEQQEPKSIAEMTPAERQTLLSRRQAPAGDAHVEIGGSPPHRRVVRLGGRLLILVGIAAAFIAGFFQFTGSWRVAMIVVGLMGGYMLFIGRLTEGRADRLD